MSSEPTTALVLTGGGARAAYQVGLLRCLARHLPEARLPVITGVSAGAINAAYLAAHPGPLRQAAKDLSHIWTGLDPGQVFRVGTLPLARNVVRWATRLGSGGSRLAPEARSLLDTAPLDHLLRTSLGTVDGELEGVARNLAGGHLEALALTTLRYSTSQTVTWVQGSQFEAWERPNRLGRHCRMSVDHIMASAALPLLFPAIRLGDGWYGDGGIRMLSPLAPAVHLGADRILAISTRYPRSAEESAVPAVRGYPPIAQVGGSLLNAVFLDAFDQDAAQMERINRLLERVPGHRLGHLRPIRLLVLRPSRDLGRLAAEYEPRLPASLRFITRGLGTRETTSPDLLSLLLFQSDYVTKLIEIGEADAEARRDEIGELLGR